MHRQGESASITGVKVSAYCIPTDQPEADGTLEWDHTILVLAEVAAGGKTGIGFTYADKATAVFIEQLLAKKIANHDAFDIRGCWLAMVRAIRNLGRPGVSSMAISAVDIALWDLKAKLLGLPLVKLIGEVRESAPIYGSGGFTSYSIAKLSEQLGGWVAEGIPRVKMKIGSHPTQDPERVKAARGAIGAAELFVDANGAYDRKHALILSEIYAAQGVRWFEEPVSSDDLEGLRVMRDRAPAAIEIAAGEYGYDLWYFRRMLDAGAVDVLQADATRCGGISGFLGVGELCAARSMPLSGHCAPSVHAHPCCALAPLRHLEYFHDHARIEHMLFDGALNPSGGALTPDRSRPGLGLEFKRQDAARYAI